MRQTVRALAASPIAVAIIVLVVMIGAAILAVATSGDESAQSAPTESIAAPSSQTPAAQAPAQRDDDRSTGITGAVAGFGLVALWIIGGGTALYRSRRRQSRRTALITQDNEETAP